MQEKSNLCSVQGSVFELVISQELSVGAVSPIIYLRNQQYNKPAPTNTTNPNLHFLDSIKHQVNQGYRLCGGGFTRLFAVLKDCW